MTAVRIPRTHTDRGITIGTRNYSTGEREIVLVNPEDRSDHGSNRWILGFGAYGDTLLSVWACGIEDAIEVAAAWLAEHAPGHVMADGCDEHTALVREACEHAGLAWPAPQDAWDDPRYQAARESAETDLTYTESGYLTSYEWTIVAESPTRADLEKIVGVR